MTADRNRPPRLAYRLEDQIGHLLRRAHQRASGIFQERIGESGLTPTQFAALVRLLEEGQVSQNRLGRLTAMDPATIQGVTRRLIARGLLETRRDPHDRRRLLLSLSRQGEAVIRAALPNGPEISDATLAPLDPRERALLLELLRRIG